MMITTFMHVIEKLYASRINLNTQRLIIHTLTFSPEITAER